MSAEIEKTLLRLLDNHRKNAILDEVKATAAHAADVCGHTAWDQANPGDGVGSFSQNPYQPEYRRGIMEKAKEKARHMEEVYQYVLNKVIDAHYS